MDELQKIVAAAIRADKMRIILEHVIERIENAERLHFPERGYAHIYKDGIPEDCYELWHTQFANILTAIQNRDYAVGFIPDRRYRITIYKGDTPHNPDEIVFPSNWVDCESDKG